MHVAHLTVNAFAENSYVIWGAGPDCALIDPGVSTPAECEALEALLTQHALRPTRVLLTHAHLDHVLGLPWVERRYGLRPWLPAGEREWLRRAPDIARMYGLPAPPAMPEPEGFIQAGKDVTVGGLTLAVLSTPGHSPDSVCYYHAPSANVIVGDVLFAGSIGRTDLPGGDLPTLMRSIYDVLLPLGDAVTAHPGHGPASTLGHERLTNPFLT